MGPIIVGKDAELKGVMHWQSAGNRDLVAGAVTFDAIKHPFGFASSSPEASLWKGIIDLTTPKVGGVTHESRITLRLGHIPRNVKDVFICGMVAPMPPRRTVQSLRFVLAGVSYSVFDDPNEFSATFVRLERVDNGWAIRPIPLKERRLHTTLYRGWPGVETALKGLLR